MKKYVPCILSVLILLVAWHVASVVVGSSLIVPSIAETFYAFCNLVKTGSFWLSAGTTFLRVFESFLISIVAGSLIGFFAGKSGFFKSFIKIPLSILRATPVVALILILIFVLKTDKVPVAVSVLMTLPVTVTAIANGFEETSEYKKLKEMGTLYMLSEKQKLKYITLPKLIPFFKSAVISSFGMSWKVVCAGEVLCYPKRALGSIMATAQVQLESSKVVASAIFIVAVSCLFEGLLSFLVFKLPERIKAVKEKRTQVYSDLDEKEILELRDKCGLYNRRICTNIEHLSVTFKDGNKEQKVFEDYSISFEEGKITALISPSGSGKTTLLNYMAFNSECAAYCFQESRLLEKETVLLNVALPLFNLYGKEKAFGVAAYYLKAFGLENRLYNYAATLSGGEKQRVNLARSLAFPCELLLLDEPFSSIDEELKEKILSFVQLQVKQGNRTAVFVTHNPQEALKAADTSKSLK